MGDGALPDLILEPRQTDLGGFSVQRVLPAAGRKSVGPFVFFDHLGPVDFAPGTGIDVRPHPHIGLATITYLFEGEVRHRDSLGKVQDITPGAINLMTAGRGIVHSERTSPEVRAAGHRVHALQLWIALPEDQQECEPGFHHYPAKDLPAADYRGAKVRVMIGSAYGLQSPVSTRSPMLYAEVKLPAGREIDLPEGVGERAVFTVEGGIEVANRKIPPQHMAVFDDKARIRLRAREDSRLAIIGGEPLGRRHVWWNLVSTRQDLIDRAKDDWQAGRFPQVPGETEFIPLPD